MEACKRQSTSVQVASHEDLAEVLCWLQREREIDGEGFWDNRTLVAEAYRSNSLYVIREGGRAVAFHAGEIMSVRSEFRRRGYGASLFEAWKQRALEEDRNILRVQCSPVSSRVFWKSMGFREYPHPHYKSGTFAYRKLHHKYKVPLDAVLVPVHVRLFTESALGQEDPSKRIIIGSDDLMGYRKDGLTVCFEHRLIFFTGEEPNGKDLVIEITAEDFYYFGRINSDEADLIGFQEDPADGVFFMDSLYCSPNQ